MDNLLSVQQKRAAKQAKTKKKPVKVVYISNPMKVKTSASEFRALVQELTGQDADMPDPARFPEIGGVGSDDHHHQEVPEGPGDQAVHEVPTMNPCGELAKKSDLSCEPYDDDDVFMPQIIENFPGIFPSNMWCESSHVDVLKSLDAM
ncbi:unnamed protein product [Ilex paraguariensis]|uniref:VQ domain-containing protein n=1 Tax=Ilex paraguariensis TaxID=185542 RepID=A0ABC8V595_9AQUA